MMDKDVKLSGKCYFFTMKALCKAGHLEEVFTYCALLLLFHTIPLI